MSAFAPVIEKFDQAAKAIDPTGVYRRQKLATVSAYALISLLTIAWSISGGDLITNALGARIDSEIVADTNERWYLVHNDSGDDWNGVAFTLDDLYRLELDKPIPAGKTTKIFVRDFRYVQHVPRPVRPQSWRVFASKPPPSPFAAKDYKPRAITILTQEGNYTKKLP